MKVLFLRNYENYKIGIIAEVNIDEKEKKYLLNTGTIEIIEDDEEISVVESPEIPVVETKTGRRNSKKEVTNE